MEPAATGALILRYDVRMSPGPPPTSPLRHFLLGGEDRCGFLQRFGVGVLIAILLVGVYQVVGDVVTAGHRDLSTPLDRAIPFLPWTAWFYIPGYVLVFLIPILAMREWPVYIRAFKALVLTSLPTWTVHLLMPVAYPRPAAPQGPSLAEAMMRLLWRFDPPHNTFPSLHVGLAWTVVLATWGYSRKAGLGAAFFATLMTLSVLTTKQHFLVDVAGGVVAASLTWALLLRRVPASAVEAERA